MKTVTFKRSQQHHWQYRELYHEVQKCLKALPATREKSKRFFALVMPLAYFGCYLTALAVSGSPEIFLLCYAAMGVVSVFMFINLIHDAVHHHVFRKKAHNEAYLLVFDLLGGNSFIWKKRHLLLHHNFQNVAGFDADIEQSGPVKIFPQQEGKKIHRYQHLFVFLLYPLFLFNWVFVRDFRDFFSRNRIIRRHCSIPRPEYVKLLVFKGLFYGYLLVLPVLLGISWPTVLGGTICLMVVGSIVAMLSLLTPHANSANSFPVADSSGCLHVSWLEHQFLTTNDLMGDSWFSRHVMGNFNYHLAHHLFPQIHSAYAPEVTGCIREFALKYGYPYKRYALGTCLRYHYELIRQNAGHPDIFEEDM